MGHSGKALGTQEGWGDGKKGSPHTHARISCPTAPGQLALKPFGKLCPLTARDLSWGAQTRKP